LVRELLPIGCGFLLGAVACGLRPSLRRPVVAVLAIALGVTATVLTGEASISWAFVLIDIPMVAVAASVGLLVGRRLDRAMRKAKVPGGGT
jgi:peptidoglycan/LPS O-acetylase OafA/YrhL